MNLFAKARENLPYFTAALALACGLYAYFSLQYALQDMFELRPLMITSQTWPQTQGRIVSHAIRKDVSGRFSHMPVTHYLAEPEYVFSVQGQEYRARRVCPEGANCGTGTSRDDAQTLLEHYPVGLEVRVSYDPKLTPEMAEADERPWALLRPGFRPWIDRAIHREWLEALVAAGATLILTIFTIVWVRKFQKK